MIKLHENFKQKYNTITDNLKLEIAKWIEDEKDDNNIVNVIASILIGLPIPDLEPEDIDLANKYKKSTIKESLQNYVLTQLNYGVDNIPLFFIFELEHFDKFDYSDFVNSLSNFSLEMISCNIKKYFEDFLEFDKDSYSLNTIAETIEDPVKYGQLIRIKTTISIKMD